jgi:exodeoxyribonuclease VIII
VFGSAFHTLILEPHKFIEEYVVKPEPVLLKNVGREVYEAHKALVEGIDKSPLTPIPAIWFEHFMQMKESLLNHPKAWKLIQDAIYESSFFWLDEHSGLMVKSRPDILHSHIYVDIKTIDDASPQSFQKSMVNFGYHLQAAMVKDAVKIIGGETLSACINICVEKTYPYSIGIYIIDEAAIEQGQLEYKNLLLDLKQCICDNTFNDYPVISIGLPKWAL